MTGTGGGKKNDLTGKIARFVGKGVSNWRSS